MKKATISTQPMKKATIYTMSLFFALSSARCEEGSAAHPEKLTRMEEVATMPTGRFFRIDRTDKKISFGDQESIFPSCAKPSELTFDVSNLRALGSMGELGQLKALTIYRDSYRHCANPNRGFPGVWMAKDLSSYGPYFFTLDLKGEDGETKSIALNEKLPWDYSITLLDNIFPMAELKDPEGRLKIQILAFAPVSADGSMRPAGFVYQLWIENVGQKLASLLGGELRQGLAHAGHCLLGGERGIGPAHFGLHPAWMHGHQACTWVGGLCGAHHHIERGFANAVQGRIAAARALQTAHHTADAGEHATNGFHHRGDVWDHQHRAHDVGVHDTVNGVLRGRSIGGVVIDDPRHIQSEIKRLASQHQRKRVDTDGA
jgi:hypothetical protein